MKNLYKILASSIAIFAFCACSQEEMPVNQSDNNQSEVVTRSGTGIKNIVYIEVNDILLMQGHILWMMLHFSIM